MLKLMRLEFRKNRLWRSIGGAFIAFLIILGFTCLLAFAPDSKEEMFTSYDMAFSAIDLFARGTFVVFAAVLLSRIIIEEFRSKTATVLFMYPISRQKLVTAKLLVVVLFTMTTQLGTNVLAGAGFYVFNQYAELVSEPFTLTIASQALARALMSTLATGFMSLIPLYFGMRKYSTSTTIVSSLVIMAVISQSSNDFSLYSIVAVPIGLALIGAVIAWMTVHNIARADVLK